jgi:hypothetical protein
MWKRLLWLPSQTVSAILVFPLAARKEHVPVNGWDELLQCRFEGNALTNAAVAYHVPEHTRRNTRPATEQLQQSAPIGPAACCPAGKRLAGGRAPGRRRAEAGQTCCAA